MRLSRYTLVALLGALTAVTMIAAGCGPASNSNDGNAAGGNDVASTGGGGTTGGDVTLTDEEMERGKKIFFDRCAGCHGAMRKGATGLNLEPHNTKPKGTAYLKAIIHDGTPAGMPEWGKSGILSDEEVDLMARYIQVDPPAPPEWGLDDMRGTHKLYVKPEDRPKTAPTERNWQNYFGFILRDVGKVAIIDGDTKELVSVVDTGFAVHILRTSADGRYFYSIGRDGRVTMIDLWMEKPDKVAEVKATNDARSIETSKYGEYKDKYLIVGGYWPPMGAILRGDTLEPIKAFSTSGYEIDDGKFVREARVAVIVADHHSPRWVVNVKETGQVWLVDYSKLGNGEGTLTIDQIQAERYLHDGGWALGGRYFMVAANARNKVAVIDVLEQKLVTNVPTQGVKPHPGRGANVDHPEYGPLWATGHIGSNDISFIGTDPEGHPDNAWKVVKVAKMPESGGGNLFVKTHPNSSHVWADRPLHPNVELADSLFVFDKVKLEHKKTLIIPEKHRGKKAVHLEYNKAGTEVWVAVWGKKDGTGAILVYDDETLELKAEITGDWCVTPTGHFNVFNTMKDIY